MIKRIIAGYGDDNIDLTKQLKDNTLRIQFDDDPLQQSELAIEMFERDEWGVVRVNTSAWPMQIFPRDSNVIGFGAKRP